MPTNTLAEMKASVDLCNTRAVILEEYRQYQELANLEFMTMEEYQKDFFDKNAPKTFYGITSFIISLICAVLLIAILNLPSGLQGPGSFLILILGTVLLYNLVFKRIYYSLHKADFQQYDQTRLEYDELLPEILALCNATKEKLTQLEAKMENDDYCIIPKKYWHKANELFLLIKNKRATDIVSAINKYEDIQHQIRMEGMAAQSMAYNEMTMYAAEQARINSEIAAKKAGEAAFVSKLNLAYTFFKDTDD